MDVIENGWNGICFQLSEWDLSSHNHLHTSKPLYQLSYLDLDLDLVWALLCSCEAIGSAGTDYWSDLYLYSKFFFSFESFSERFKKTVRGFIKILETLQFGLSFNTIRQVLFCFGQKKIVLLAVNNAFCTDSHD
jgi:hypothetical protein